MDGSGKAALPNATFVQVTHKTSTLAWSTGELKSTVRTFEEAVTVEVVTETPPGKAGAAPFKSVSTAEHPEISNPGGMLLSATFTWTPADGAGMTAPVLNCAPDLKRSE